MDKAKLEKMETEKKKKKKGRQERDSFIQLVPGVSHEKI